MEEFRKIFVFNSFPIFADRFFELVNILCKHNDFATLFLRKPRLLEAIYVTMTDMEVKALEKRLEITAMVETFALCDALYLYKKKLIVIHVPAMVRMLSVVQTSQDDPRRRGLFAMHFFSCLFHELFHANDTTRVVMDYFYTSVRKQVIVEHTDKWQEKRAQQAESKHVKLLARYLKRSNASWLRLAEILFDWGILQKYIR